ncbi:MAG TPA: cation:proton antiporter, partial [Galbitalea sp.]
IVAVVMTLVINVLGGWLIARLNHLPGRAGLGIGIILQNRGEFALILATLASAAGLDARLTPFAGLYVLIMAIIGPVLTVNSEHITAALFRTKRRPVAQRADDAAEEAIALMSSTRSERDDDSPHTDDEDLGEPDGELSADQLLLDTSVQQAMEQSDEQSERKRDPEY